MYQLTTVFSSRRTLKRSRFEAERLAILKSYSLRRIRFQFRFILPLGYRKPRSNLENAREIAVTGLSRASILSLKCFVASCENTVLLWDSSLAVFKAMRCRFKYSGALLLRTRWLAWYPFVSFLFVLKAIADWLGDQFEGINLAPAHKVKVSGLQFFRAVQRLASSWSDSISYLILFNEYKQL